MIIRNIASSLDATHFSREELSRNESLQVWRDGGEGSRPARAEQNSLVPDRVIFSAQAAAMYVGRETVAQSAEVPVEEDDSMGLPPKFQAMKRILEALTGRKMEISNLRPMGEALPTATEPAPASVDGQSPEPAEPQRVGWGLSYDLSETYSEEETTSFSAAGTLLTADGREIHFETNLVMSRSFMETNELHLRAGDARFTDPLVINFSGTAADFESSSYAFDLNSDGREESMPLLSGASGYLVLDRNGDGMVNNGRELFGPRTGNGFAELRQYDQDGNGWIDENDPVFDQLKIWVQDRPDKGMLYSLDEKKVGAILLDSLATEFTDKDGLTPLARIRETGLFFFEDGRPGTVQQVDLVT